MKQQYSLSIADALTGIEQGRWSMQWKNICCKGLCHLLTEEDEFDQSLWDRLWRLKPELCTFWNKKIYWDEIDDKPEVQAYFCATEYLWKDLHLVQSYLFGVAQVAWVHEELERRLAWARNSLRRLWIAAVVCEKTAEADTTAVPLSLCLHLDLTKEGASAPAVV
jgi:hypothetical protein